MPEMSYGRETLKNLVIYFLALLILLCSQHSPSSAQEVGLDDGKNIPLFNVRLEFDANDSTGNFEQTRLNSRGAIFKHWGDQFALLNGYRYQYMKNGDIKFSDDLRDISILTLRTFDIFRLYGLVETHQRGTAVTHHRPDRKE